MRFRKKSHEHHNSRRHLSKYRNVRNRIKAGKRRYALPDNLIIVSNTSPIASLAAVGQLDLLKELYQRIIIPETVDQELIGANPTVPGAKEVSTFPWIETKIVVNQLLVQHNNSGAIGFHKKIDGGLRRYYLNRQLLHKL